VALSVLSPMFLWFAGVGWGLGRAVVWKVLLALLFVLDLTVPEFHKHGSRWLP
jgi:hypothetical protein